MRKFKVQYAQVFEYEVDAKDLDAAARSVQQQVQPEYDPGYIKVLSIEEAGVSRGSMCNDCQSNVFRPSRIEQYWPRVDKKAKKK